MAMQDVLSIRKKKKLPIPKDFNIKKLWNIIGPVVAKEVAGPQYLPIPNLLDTNGYDVGYIFLQTAGQTSCFVNSPLLKVLGPIRDYVKKNETEKKWFANGFPVVKTFPENKNLQVIMQHNGNELTFEGYNYYFLSKPDEMVVENNVTIDRSTDEDLRYAEWIGIIRDVMVADCFQIKAETKHAARFLQICDRPHTVLFSYEIYKIDSAGKTKNTSYILPNLPWEGLECECQDGLPLPTL